MFLQIHTITMQVQTAWVKRKNLQVCLQHVMINNLLRSCFCFLFFDWKSTSDQDASMFSSFQRNAWFSDLARLFICVPLLVVGWLCVFVCELSCVCFHKLLFLSLWLTSLLDVRTINASQSCQDLRPFCLWSKGLWAQTPQSANSGDWGQTATQICLGPFSPIYCLP